MASPIQVVLNTSHFIQDFQRPPGGGSKDIYKGRNDAFRQHRDRLAAQVRSIAASGASFARSSVAAATVTLAPEALAKSNRPGSLLNPDRIPSLGTGRPAELLIQVTPQALFDLANRIEGAEIEPRMAERWDKKREELVVEPRPSKVRCDVGAIEAIEFWGASDRRTLSIDQISEWLEQPNTPSGLIVHLFSFHDSNREIGAEALRLSEQLSRLSCPTRFSRLGEGEESAWYLLIDLPPDQLGSRSDLLDKVLALLEQSFLVRHISVPARASASERATATIPKAFKLSRPQSGATYPLVAIIDGGLGPKLSHWVLGSKKIISSAHDDVEHGALIGGLLVAGQGLNSPDIAPEPDGCQLLDLCMIPREDPTQNLFRRYYSSVESFFDELERTVAEYVQQYGVRVFNFSLNYYTLRGDGGGYAYETRRLDDIAVKHDVIFVISAGNLTRGAHRPEWPADDVKALGILVLAYDDQIVAPADSLTNLAVAALNPPGVHGRVPGVPAAYSRRGPSPFGGVKPDVAHYGGCAGNGSTGLLSMADTGGIKPVQGTSFAAPLVAKALARYAQELEGHASRELLIGLLIHSCVLPAKFLSPALATISRDQVGFGVPGKVTDALDGSPHSVTIVFEQAIPKGKRLEFDFAWPKSLVTPEGKCKGRGRLTLVARPTIKTDSGHEAVRVQLDAHVLQKDKKGKSKGGHFSITNMPTALQHKEKVKESALIRHGLKWSPIKTYEFESEKGVGQSSNWRLAGPTIKRLALQ